AVTLIWLHFFVFTVVRLCRDLHPFPTRRSSDLVGERVEGPIFFRPDGQRLDRHGAARVVRRVASRAGITKPVGPHTLRHAFITRSEEHTFELQSLTNLVCRLLLDKKKR